jgi:hypothetical protein
MVLQEDRAVIEQVKGKLGSFVRQRVESVEAR